MNFDKNDLSLRIELNSDNKTLKISLRYQGFEICSDNLDLCDLKEVLKDD